MTTYCITQQRSGTAFYTYAYGWFDYVVPAGYVTGSGLVVKCDAAGLSGSKPFWVVPVTVDGGSLTSAPQGTVTDAGRATIQPGQSVLTYFDSDSSKWTTTAPGTRAIVSAYCGGTNLTWTLDGISNADGSLVLDGSVHPGIFPPGSGEFQIDNFVYSEGTFQSGIVFGPQYWSGGAGFGIGPANGSHQYQAGDTISLVFYTKQDATNRVQIYSIQVDAGAGGISTLDLTSMKVCENPVNPPAGLPVAIGTDGAASEIGDFRSWYLLPIVEPLFSVGQVITTNNCAQVEITEVISPTEFSATVISGELATVPGDPNGTPLPLEEWEFSSPSATVGGLDHLESMEVMALADGQVQGPFTVSGGAITLPQPASSVIVGLAYTSQLQTLYIDLETPTGSVQGRRKLISAVNLRLNCTRGIDVGADFEHLVAMKDLATPSGVPQESFTGDKYIAVRGSTNDPYGQVCIQQTNPLPVSVLGIAIEVTPGDTGR